MNYRLTILFFFFTPLIFGQTNLVPNPGFENNNSIPSPLCDTALECSNWYSPTFGSPDYFNKMIDCWANNVPNNYYGYQYANNGNAYFGFASICVSQYGVNKREYIQIKLLDTLKAGEKYCVGFYVSLADSVEYASDGIAAYFSDTAYTNYDSMYYFLLPFTPQVHNQQGNIITDRQNWTLISDSFIANGGELYLTIGNFWNDTITNVQYMGDIITYNGEPYSYYYIDDVYVIKSPHTFINNLLDSQQILNIFPNPATSELTMDFVSNDKYYFDLFDLLGSKRLSARLDSNSKTVDLTSVDSGVYVFTIVDSKGDIIKTDKLIIIK